MKTPNPDKIVKVKVDNSNIMSAYERAELRITSPTGRTIYIMKFNIGKFTQEQKDLFWKVCGEPMVRFIGEREVTVAEMGMLLEMSKFSRNFSL